MKTKVLSVLLAVAMLAALVVPAFAIDVTVARSSVEATRAEVASITFGDWAADYGVADGVLTVKEGDYIWLGDLLAGYNEGKTAIRVSPECTYALVANTDKLTVNASGYMVGAKATAEGEVVEILATSVDNKEITFVIKVKVIKTSATTTTTVPGTVINATGYKAEGMDWTLTKDADAITGSAEVKVSAISHFAGDKVVFTAAQQDYLMMPEYMQVTGWANKKVNGVFVKVPLAFAVDVGEDFEEAYLSAIETDTKFVNYIDVPVSFEDFVEYLGSYTATLVDDSTVKYNFTFDGGLVEVGESLTFSITGYYFPVVNTNGTEGYAVVPAVKGTAKVVAKGVDKTEGENTVPQSSLAVVPSAVSVEVGKFVTVNALFSKASELEWGVSHAVDAQVAPDYSVVWEVSDSNPDDDINEYDVCKLMGVRVGNNVVVVEALADADSAFATDYLVSKALVTVVPRVDAVVDTESDVPQTGAALLANLF